MGAGEGSRGGKVIGHSRSGRPIYASAAHEGSGPGPFRITHDSSGARVSTGTSPAGGMQTRHEAIRASDAAHAASAAVAAKGKAATGSDHTMAASQHLAAAALADKAGHRLAMQGHQELAQAHLTAARGDRAGAEKAFGSYAKDSEQTHYRTLAGEKPFTPFNAGPSDPVHGGSGRSQPYNRDVNKEYAKPRSRGR